MKIKKCKHQDNDLFIIEQLQNDRYLIGCECGENFIYKYNKLPKELKKSLEKR